MAPSTEDDIGGDLWALIGRCCWFVLSIFSGIFLFLHCLLERANPQLSDKGSRRIDPRQTTVEDHQQPTQVCPIAEVRLGKNVGPTNAGHFMSAGGLRPRAV